MVSLPNSILFHSVLVAGQSAPRWHKASGGGFTTEPNHPQVEPAGFNAPGLSWGWLRFPLVRQLASKTREARLIHVSCEIR